MKDFEKRVKAYALKNAVAYEGKAQQGAVISGLFNEGLKKSEISKYGKKISDIIKQVNSLPASEQKKEFEKLKKFVHEREVREGLRELPNVKKSGVIMRFAPSASGPWHIGHAITVCLSGLYVEKYGGTLYIRIEDTNPDNIYKPAYKMIKDEAKWLLKGLGKVVIQSERINFYYKYAEMLIKKKSAYVCECATYNFRDYIQKKKNCPCRKHDVKENLKKWKKMLDKKNGYAEGKAVLRFKSDMKHKNPAMRDFPLARINLTPHALQGEKYRVWPLMNLAVATDDIEMKMTHVIRGKDHRDNAIRQEMIYKVLGKKFPWVGFIGRIKFKDLELSSTKMRESIEKKKYKGWDDEKLPTIASLKKQGYKPKAFWKFAEQVGLSEADKVMDKKEYFTLLKAFNKE
ncbi:glutamate--tRNA ligase family protein [Nanoarchaeota archaeon]